MPRVVSFARLLQGGRWRIEAMRALKEPALYWFSQGLGRITVAGTTRGYAPAMAVFVPPGVLHGIEAQPRLQGYAVFFGKGSDLELPSTPAFLRPKDALAQRELVNLIENLQRELETPRTSSARAVTALLGLLSVWIDRQREHEKERTAETSRAPVGQKLVARYTALIERDLNARRTVADFAEALGVTATHLTRACRASCGKSAHSVFEERLMFEARRLLAETRLPIQEIAARLGFASASYFTRAFRRHTGLLPSAFRRRPMLQHMESAQRAQPMTNAATAPVQRLLSGQGRAARAQAAVPAPRQR